MRSYPLALQHRTVYWTVAAHDALGRSVYRTMGLIAPCTVRHWLHLLASLPATATVELAEHHLVEEREVIAFEALPGEGEPTPLTELPADAHAVKRFYRFARTREDGTMTGFGPSVLRTGDDVRRFHARTIANQGHPHAVRVDVTSLRILDLTLTHYTRDIQRADLPTDASAALLGQLSLEGLYWLPLGETAGESLCVPLADRSEITIRGLATGGSTVGSRRTRARHGGWVAKWDDQNGSRVEIYRSPRPARAMDTIALQAAVFACARRHGSAPVLTDTPPQPGDGDLPGSS